MLVQKVAKVTPSDVVLSSVALERIVAEVRSGAPLPTTGYNRTYNRHNR